MGEIRALHSNEQDKPERRVSPRLRFEVFKRDDFTCQYCGRKTPEAVLEADHIVPVAAGGSSEIENLVTSCWECNRGKGASLLDETAPVSDIHEQTIVMLERERQLREYNWIRRQQREREDDDIADLLIYWQKLYPYDKSRNLTDSTLRGWLKDHGVVDIMDALEITAGKTGSAYQAVRYTAGILRNWREQRQASRSE